MKNVSRIAWSVLVLLFFASAVGILPTAGKSRTGKQAGQEPAPQTETVSGKITSLEKTSFVLTISTSASSQRQLATTDSSKTMHFDIDKNTTIDGKLQVGATADVTYRQEASKNIAVSVHVVS